MLEAPEPERGKADPDLIDRLDLEWLPASVQSPCEKYAGWGGRGRLLIWGVISLSSQAAGSLNRTQLDNFNPCLSSVASVVTGPMNSGVSVTVGWSQMEMTRCSSKGFLYMCSKSGGNDS